MKKLNFNDVNWKRTELNSVDDFRIFLGNGRSGITTLSGLSEYFPADKAPSVWWEEKFEQLSEEYVQKALNTRTDSDHKDINSYTADLLSFLRYTFAEPENNESRVVFIRPNSTGKVLRCKEGGQGYGKLIDNIMSSLVQAGVDKKIKKAFKKGFCEEVANSSNYYKDDNLVTPLLKTYLSDNIDNILSSSDFYVNEEIVNFTNDENTLAFTQMLHLEEPSYLPTPTIDKWLSEVLREDQIACFRAWLYATTQDVSKIRQVAWLVDLKGNTGKSSFIGAFDRWFSEHAPNSVTSFNPKSMNSQFGMSQMYGYRIGTNADVKNTMLLKSTEFHSITGGDNVGVEFKGQNSFKAKMYSMFLLASNVKPSVSINDEHETSRILYLPMSPMGDEYLKTQCVLDDNGEIKRNNLGAISWRSDNNFDQHLYEEMDDFIINSKPYYEALGTRNAIIISNHIVQDMKTDLNDVTSENVEDFVNREFSFGKNFFVTNKDFKEMLDNNNDEIKEFGDSYNTPRDVIKKYLESKHNVKFKQVVLPDGSRPRGAQGIALKDSIYNNQDLSDSVGFKDIAINDEEFKKLISFDMKPKKSGLPKPPRKRD